VCAKVVKVFGGCRSYKGRYKCSGEIERWIKVPQVFVLAPFNTSAVLLLLLTTSDSFAVKKEF
jgi:hypothetical protein